MRHDDYGDLLALYALDALEGPERDGVIDHLYWCDRCVGELIHNVDVMEAVFHDAEPPLHLWASIEARLGSPLA